MPKSYIYEAYRNDGFGWFFEYQAYPIGFDTMCPKANKSFCLPAKVMPELAPDAPARFSNWVRKQK